MIDVKRRTAELIKAELGLQEETVQALFDLELIDERNAVRYLIREEYRRKINVPSKTHLKVILADKYCLSFPTVEKYVQNI